MVTYSIPHMDSMGDTTRGEYPPWMTSLPEWSPLPLLFMSSVRVHIITLPYHVVCNVVHSSTLHVTTCGSDYMCYSGGHEYIVMDVMTHDIMKWDGLDHHIGYDGSECL